MKKSTIGLFDPKTAFFSLPIVKWTMVIGILLITIVCLLIILNSSRDLDLTAEGFNEFYKMMRFPTFLLGFFAALLALYATNHRSEQNKAAMHLAESQNRFSNYYKHIEEYENYLQNQFKDYSNEARPKINIQKLHRCLYPNAKSDGIQFSQNVEIIIFENTFRFIEHFVKTDFSISEEIENLIVKTDDCYENIQSSLMNSIKFKQEDGSVNFNSDNGPIKIPASRVRNFILSRLTRLEFINAVLHFEETFNSDELELILLHAKFAMNMIPDISIGGNGVIAWHDNPEVSSTKQLEVLENRQTDLGEKVNILFQKRFRS
jgi:hypothetical protein